MNNLRETLQKKQKDYPKLVTTYKLQLTSYEIRERALFLAEGLTCTEAPNDMTAFYCKAFKTLGESKYCALVSMAKDPSVKKPKHIFGWLLKEEIKKATCNKDAKAIL